MFSIKLSKEIKFYKNTEISLSLKVVSFNWKRDIIHRNVSQMSKV